MVLIFYAVLLLFQSVRGDIVVENNDVLADIPLPSSGDSAVYKLDHRGIFHCHSQPTASHTGKVRYSVLHNGVLVTDPGPYSVTYKINKRGDLIPLVTNQCIYKTDTPAFYLKGHKNMLIPINIYSKPDSISHPNEGHQLVDKKTGKRIVDLDFISQTRNPEILRTHRLPIIPDLDCYGDATLFLLKSNGIFSRQPPDEFIPNGMQLKFELHRNGVLLPMIRKGGLGLTYFTSDNGNLQPSFNNSHTLTTLKETSKSFLLGEGGVLAPVNDYMDINKTIDYYYDGKLIHRSKQYNQAFSNSSMLILKEKSSEGNITDLLAMGPGPKFECSSKRLRKRDTGEMGYDSKENQETNKLIKKPQPCDFAIDDKGKRIPLEPFIKKCGNIVLYKLTCKGHLKRLDCFKEPEHGFELGFKLLDNFILVPSKRCNGKIHIRYKLVENGNLIPLPYQDNTFKKAPASMIYYVLGKNRELIPVRLHILTDNQIELYYQDCLIYTMGAEAGKHLELFTTLYVPLYAYVNGRVVVGYSDPVAKPSTGATWTNPNTSGENIKIPSKNLYLVGPNGLKIKIMPDLNENGVPVVFEMDCNGVCHKSPKDDNKNMLLRSYKLLKEGILVPTNETNCYIFLVDKLGNMLPYCYPESKLRAPFGLTVKYVQCLDGVLLPVLVQVINDFVQFSFDDTIVYRKRVYTLEQVLELKSEIELKPKIEEYSLYKDKKGNVVYYELCDDVFIRQPKQNVETCAVHTIGYFKILPCFDLIQEEIPDPKYNNLEVSVEKNGDLKILPSSAKKPSWADYLMLENGDLISVDIKKKEGYIKFYKNGVRLFKQKIENWKIEDEKTSEAPKEVPTPSGKDPMGIFKDPPPKENKSCKDPEYIPIPIKGIRVRGKNKCLDKEKCEQIRRTIEEIMSKDPSMMNLEIEMTDDIMREIYDLAHKCSKIKEKRDTSRYLTRDSNWENDSESTC